MVASHSSLLYSVVLSELQWLLGNYLTLSADHYSVLSARPLVIAHKTTIPLSQRVLNDLAECSIADLGGFSRGSESSPLIKYKVQVAERMGTSGEVELFNYFGVNRRGIMRLC